jgi:putative transposase
MEPPHQRIDDMPNYRRADTPGATWFFTVNLLQRHGNDLLVREIRQLRACVLTEKQRRLFSILAWVVLPEHMHWIWRLPEGDADYSTRWRRIKTDFSRGLSATERRSAVRVARGERGIWQRRYWEKQIRDSDDLIRHVEYIHFNPVKHGYAARPNDWPHSSFRSFVDKGRYPVDWAASTTLDWTSDG